MHKRKLIEVALPLEAINRESEKDGPKRKNHPWRMHYWWARRKLPTSRAVLFAQMVDDPSSRPDRFPTKELQRAERERLHALIERLVKWDQVQDPSFLAEIRSEIQRSAGAPLPAILDPFAGGGSIPLEAQRLGLESHASDLNPVAVLINKALIEIPSAFCGKPPVFPELAESRLARWDGAEGLGADVRAYGDWIRSEARRRLAAHYPDVEGQQTMGWVWARTVRCPNPACGIEMPLARSWWLSNRRGKEAFVVPKVVLDSSQSAGQRVEFEVREGRAGFPANDGTVHGRHGATCLACATAVPMSHLRAEGKANRLGKLLMAIVALGDRRRHYLTPTPEHLAAAEVDRPANSISGDIATNPRWFSPPAYGLTTFDQLFTNRQLLALTTLSDLVMEARERVLSDGGSVEYADAVATYLGLAVSRGSDYQSSITTWHNKNEQIRNVFSRQAIPMSWDFFEVNPLGDGSGTWTSQCELAGQALDGLRVDIPAAATQAPAQSAAARPMVLSTDPPYYDNVGYSDLSDFFYVWLRRSLRTIHPDLLGTMLVPKAEELVANDSAP